MTSVKRTPMATLSANAIGAPMTTGARKGLPYHLAARIEVGPWRISPSVVRSNSRLNVGSQALPTSSPARGNRWGRS